MSFSIGKGKLDYARYILVGIISIALLYTIKSLGMELIVINLFLIAASIFTISFSKKKYYLEDIILPLYASFFGIYFNHLLNVFGHNFFTSWGFKSVILYTLFFQDFGSIAIELFFILGLYFLCRALFLSPRVSAIIAPIPTLILCIANFFIIRFKGQELSPLDITSIKTALNVSHNYVFPFVLPFALAYAPTILYILSVIRIKPVKKHNSKSSLIFAGIVVVIVGLFSATFSEIKKTHKTEYWGDKASSTNGYITNFSLLCSEIKLSEPDNYEKETYSALTSTPNDIQNNNTNIIVIMNESFADLSIYEDILGIYTDPLEFYRNQIGLPNVRAGYAYASVFGGNTANSEFEFLTGLSVSRLPAGSIPYSLYIKKPLYSLPQFLSDIGYSTTAMHPFLSSSWNRTTVYPNLGFDSMMFIDDFQYTDNDFIRVPSAIPTAEGSLSDECAYDNLLQLINTSDSTSPNFYFMVTIQNHGGYSPENEKLEINNYISNVQNSDEINVFLTNTSRSDAALENFLNELSQREERYVVLMFGDHQPAIELLENVEESEVGGRKWVVPYILWSNYDLPEGMAGNNITTSINYLGLDVLNASGIPLPPYFNYINDIRQEIPIINASGYYSASANSWNEFANSQANSVDDYALNRYYGLQYYSLFDS